MRKLIVLWVKAKIEYQLRTEADLRQRGFEMLARAQQIVHEELPALERRLEELEAKND